MIKSNTHFQHHICLSIFECLIGIYSDSSSLLSILEKIYAGLQVPFSNKKINLEYRVQLVNSADNQHIYISRDGCDDLVTNDVGEFIFLLEKDMTIELQKIRSDLLFVHSAALEYDNKGFLLVAPSGAGKSTTTWALVNLGCNYLSDELAPINLKSMMIYPYPHAICLKARPPMFVLPETCLVTSQTIHVYGNMLEERTQPETSLLKAIIFLEYHPELPESKIISISRGESAAKLYSNSLNILAHSNDDCGMKVAIQAVSKTHNYRLLSNQLDDTSKKIMYLIQSLD
ncbi:MAG: hypothetical protein OQK76_11795 [Gammaproteobacteria bacterium]|nr:hypothetical protein [Gammaproteobacteria bacterium]MCW9004498.1 hypothetical protein [Gammaproteobacteria bacterium]